jgi:hypothetical protein
MGNSRFIPHDDIIRRIKARVAWMQKGAQYWENWADYDQNEAYSCKTRGNEQIMQRREKEMDQGLCGARDRSGKKARLRRTHSDDARTGT